MITAAILSYMSLKGGEGVNKFLGVGLVQALSLALFTMLVIVVAKTVLVKHPVPGLTNVVAAV